MQFRALQPALQAQTLAQRLRTERHLLVLDNLESITGEFLAIPHTLPAAEQAGFAPLSGRPARWADPGLARLAEWGGLAAAG